MRSCIFNRMRNLLSSKILLELTKYENRRMNQLFYIVIEKVSTSGLTLNLDNSFNNIKKDNDNGDAMLNDKMFCIFKLTIA